jgi:hypothetical protein
MMFFAVFVIVAMCWCAIAKLIWRDEITWIEFGIQIGSSVALTLFVLIGSYFFNVSDQQTLIGSVTEKVRENDSHQESYDCNCRDVSSGSGKDRTTTRVCDTCWRTVYTVDWYLHTTIGKIRVDSDNSYSKSVWNTPDPDLFIKSYVGEPCAKKDSYTNYLIASKSLFNTSTYAVQTTLPVPDYPQLTNLYHITNVFSVGSSIDVSVWNNMLLEKLKTLSAKKQINVIIIVAKTTDRNYRYAVEKAWLGGKKNDYVVVLGTDDNNTIRMVEGFTFGLSQGNFLMLSQVATQLQDVSLDPKTVIDIIANNVDTTFSRKPMKDFEYLIKEKVPSTTTITILGFLQFLVCCVLTYFNIKRNLWA